MDNELYTAHYMNATNSVPIRSIDEEEEEEKGEDAMIYNEVYAGKKVKNGERL